jgi:hypothetical protein
MPFLHPPKDVIKSGQNSATVFLESIKKDYKRVSKGLDIK